MKEIKLESGATLKIGNTPFAVSKALYKAILAELKSVPLQGQRELPELYKDIFCLGFSSDLIEARVWDCFKFCTYSHGGADLKIDADTFEAEKAREDYIKVCTEVVKHNVGPFTKSLYAEYKAALEEMSRISQESKSK